MCTEVKKLTNEEKIDQIRAAIFAVQSIKTIDSFASGVVSMVHRPGINPLSYGELLYMIEEGLLKILDTL